MTFLALNTSMRSKERLKLAIYHVLKVVDGAVFLASFSLVSLELSTNWLFSEYLED
ncbi:hypothetical protein [Caldimonas sp. KR1-144]|uniref:hypothetical protein n=1 Tax=Caldimonas sp. KR1-144 TaxID=3400911 RepID=UPI003C06943E